MVIDLAMQIKDGIKHLITKNAELQRQVDALTAERDELREKYNDLLERRTNVECDCDCCKWQEERDELRRQVSELRELNDSLHARIEEAKEALS